MNNDPIERHNNTDLLKVENSVKRRNNKKSPWSIVDWFLDQAAHDGVEITNMEDLF